MMFTVQMRNTTNNKLVPVTVRAGNTAIARVKAFHRLRDAGFRVDDWIMDSINVCF